jgi:hypothetical protein
MKAAQPILEPARRAFMATFAERQFQDETVVLDGNEYRACQFHKCRMVYRGGEFSQLIDCNCSECVWGFEDAAGRTIAFMRAIYHSGSGGKELIEGTFKSIRGG